MFSNFLKPKFIPIEATHCMKGVTAAYAHNRDFKIYILLYIRIKSPPIKFYVERNFPNITGNIISSLRTRQTRSYLLLFCC